MGVAVVAAPASGGKKKGLKRPKRRTGIVNDLTPMVDIAFLLLIFYMVTTVFNTPQALEVNLPPLEAEENAIPVGESHLITLRVDAYDNLFYNIGKEDPRPLEYSGLADSLMEWVSEDVDRMVTVIKIDKNARYSRMVDIIDDIKVVEARIKQQLPDFSYRFSLVDMSQYDVMQLEEARKRLGIGGEQSG
jgi:biopolymer transport protein ExbD